MSKLNREELDRLERRELHLTIVSVVFVLILAAGLVAFMYPLVFLRPAGNIWTLRVAFFGFCALTLLFVSYLLEHQRTVKKLKQQLLAEFERNVALQHQASVDLLGSMPGLDNFWDRLTMEFRRASTTQKTLSLVLVKMQPGSQQKDASEAASDTAKAMARKLRPTDAIHRLSPELFGVVLPGTDALNAKRVAVRLQDELQAVRAMHGGSFEVSAHNYPTGVRSAHELEDIVKSQLPEPEEWAVPEPASTL
jgi:GGDEF domain-containing protein